ncbi:MAG: Biosynthetic Aromatic amino acid aminotransferase beta [uncultured Ramlibacter sp.]|uniref:Histidinol-phosphate aminotransferase n=1 Tax=uncultured Ramlibacter sp. TaxID=260755 RepID=A0A6J4QKI7_9BURK|nr:MAG: Biosynthetic Aromatic amino acid aminotransferase beta [uncultured Ramlibacter sp.]
MTASPPLQLASNENPLGMPAAAREAAARALTGADRYPDATGSMLRKALAERLGVAPEWIVLGSGSSEILTLAAQACVEPGQGVVSSQYGFTVYSQAARLAHARHTVVPARDYGHDLKAMLGAVQADTRLVFIANPNNPTGSLLGAGELLAFLETVPGTTTVLLDEAYTEYLTPEQRYDSMGWVQRFPNLIVARTFSKAYGLAGLRIGYGVAQPPLVARLNALRPRFNVTTPAIAAAFAALADNDFQARSYSLNLQGREQLARGLAELGLRCLPSAGNFVTVEIGDAAALHKRLAEQGILVSTLEAYGLPRWLRISVGLPEQNTRVLRAVADLQPARAPA